MWREINNQIADDFVQKFGQSELLESTTWLELQQQFYSVERLGYYYQQQLVAVATFIKHQLLAGYCYYYSPRGPIIIDDQQAADFWPDMLIDIGPWLAQRRAIFWRIEPIHQPNNLNFTKLGLRHGPDIQPSQSRILNINQSEEAILQQMHPKTRYNIRLANKRGVIVEEVGEAGLIDFWRLMTTTGQRDNFHLHNRLYYQAIIKAPFSRLLIARWQGQAIAAGIFAYWGQAAVYLHGASDNQHRELMAPYLIQWRAIQLARQQACQSYDLFGINPLKWPGVTRFKQGFGGLIVNYSGSFDWPVHKLLYCIYKIIRRCYRLLR